LKIVLPGHDFQFAQRSRSVPEAIVDAGAVAVRNSNHFGTAAYFTRLATLEGCIGLLTTNASPAMAPWGGRKKTVGNNPWSVAAPAGSHPPMVLDIANTVVARGKVFLARQKHLPIPSGWAINAAGKLSSRYRVCHGITISVIVSQKGWLSLQVSLRR